MEAAGLTVFDAELATALRDNMPLAVLRAVALVTHAGDPTVVGIATLVVFLRRCCGAVISASRPAGSPRWWEPP